LENDWLEAIIGLPENLFYNTGIATYIWVLSNKKSKHRKGRVQLIDATQWFTKLRKNLGQKNCEFSPEQIQQIVRTFLDFKKTEQSKIFDNADFGYWQITVERPLRLRVDLSADAVARMRTACKEAGEEPFIKVVERIAGVLGAGLQMNFNEVWAAVITIADNHDIKLTGKREKLFREVLCQRDEQAEPITKKRDKDGSVEYEPDPELRDNENVPLNDNIEDYFKREVLPHVPDSWIDHDKTVKGYEISFTKYFYKQQPLRSLDAIAGDLKKLERETEGLLQKIAG
jgi:type I restriction enzyme M protein